LRSSNSKPAVKAMEMSSMSTRTQLGVRNPVSTTKALQHNSICAVLRNLQKGRIGEIRNTDWFSISPQTLLPEGGGDVSALTNQKRQCTATSRTYAPDNHTYLKTKNIPRRETQSSRSRYRLRLAQTHHRNSALSIVASDRQRVFTLAFPLTQKCSKCKRRK